MWVHSVPHSRGFVGQDKELIPPHTGCPCESHWQSWGHICSPARPNYLGTEKLETEHNKGFHSSYWLLVSYYIFPNETEDRPEQKSAEISGWCIPCSNTWTQSQDIGQQLGAWLLCPRSIFDSQHHMTPCISRDAVLEASITPEWPICLRHFRVITAPYPPAQTLPGWSFWPLLGNLTK